MFWQLFAFSAIGWLIFLSGNFESWNKSNPNETRTQSYKNYFWNNMNYILVSFGFMIAITLIIDQGGLVLMIDYFADYDLTKVIPESVMSVANKIFCLMIGINTEAFINLFRRIKKPLT